MNSLKQLLPTDDDVAFYREHGWWVSKKVLSDASLDEAMRGAERYWNGERDWLLEKQDGYKDWKPSDGRNTIRLNEYVALQNREIRRFVEQPLLGAIAARLAGTTEIRLWESELIYKPPRSEAANAAIGWHTDRAYYMPCSSDQMITAWIPLHDCPLEMGPLTVVDGSHRWPDLAHDRRELREFLNTDLEGKERLLLEGRREARKITFVLERGQLSFHNCRTLHASGFNKSDRPRISISIHMQDRDNHYRAYFNERGERWKISQDHLCRTTPGGVPDYSDPAICPVLFKS